MKHFADYTTRETIEALVKGELQDGTRIDLNTRKDGLARVLPMFKDCFEPDENLVSEAKRILAS